MMELREAIDLVKLQPPFRPNTLKAWHVIKETVVNGTLIPADQCYEVREGYKITGLQTPAGHWQGFVDKKWLSEALTIRSAEEVRREAYAEGYRDGFKKSGWSEMERQEVGSTLIDTPQPKGGDDE